MAESVILPSEKDITIDKLDYAYIEKCSNEKELERILRTLNSGRDGYYPHLIEFCEKKLTSINPSNRALRKQQPPLSARDLQEEERQNVIDSMDQWEEEMSNLDQNMLDPIIHGKPQLNGFGDHDNLPPVRGAHVLKGNQKKKVEAGDNKKSNPDRIKSYDYKSWDKYDVDAECEKVDEQAKDAGNNIPDRKVNIPKEIDASGLTEIEKQIKATREKEKGNEAFKSGDYEEALSYYCRSLCLQPSAASYNNRALVYLRLEKWKEAKQDCNTVLSFEGEEDNLKAMLRRASACKSLGSFNEAKADLLFVLEKEPNNARAKSILKDIEKLESEKEQENEDEENISVKSGKKMVITEVEGDSEEEDEEEEIQVETKVRESPLTSLINEDSTKSVEGNIKESLLASGVKDVPPVKVEDVAAPVAALPKYPPKVENQKSKAGDFFKSGRYSDACDQYTKAIDSLSSIMKNASDPGYELGLAVLYNNRAACWLKQGNDRSCINDCDKVLEIKKWDAKAFMRRGMAYEHIEKYDKAWFDFKSAHNMDLSNNLAQDGANRTSGHLREIHGLKWRDKVPKVPSYSNFDFASFMGQNATQNELVKSPIQKVDTPKSEKEVVKSEVPRKEDEKIKKPAMQNIKRESPTHPKPENVPKSKAETPKPKPEPKATKSKSSNQKRKRNKSKSKSPKKEEIEKQQKEEIEKEEKRMKIRKDLFEKLKADGNNHVKNGDYPPAIDCYTRCIQLCPKEPASYTNRALCFLKLKKHVSAVNDCTEAIKLDPINVKAYYRRSLARKAEKFYKDAERDLKKLLEIDPANKAAKAELDVMKKLAWDEARKRAGNASDQNELKRDNVPRKKPLVIEEVDSSSSSDEGEFILPNDNETRDDQNNAQHASKLDDFVNSPSEDKKMTATDISPSVDPKIPDRPKQEKSIFADNDAYGSKSTSQQNQPNKHPTSSPTRTSPSKTTELTPFEFGAQWNIVTNKTNVAAYKAILDRVTPSDLPSLLSNKIDDHVIITVAKVALDHIEQDNDSQRAFEMMMNLTRADRFSMAAMFLSDSDKSILRATFNALSKRCETSLFNQKVFNELMKLYSL